MVAAFLHLDAADPENGGLFVYPGSHLLGPQEDVGALDTQGNFHYVDQVCRIIGIVLLRYCSVSCLLLS